jgi:hypothetical protein
VLSARTCYSAEIATYPSYALVKERFPLYCRENRSGADRNRTDDIQLAKLALSQLSYSPINQAILPCWVRHHVSPLDLRLEEVVGLGGLEPPTSRLSGARSSQLSYRPRELPRRFFLQRPSFSKSWCRATGATQSFKTKQQARRSRVGLDSETLTWST